MIVVLFFYVKFIFVKKKKILKTIGNIVIGFCCVCFIIIICYSRIIIFKLFNKNTYMKNRITITKIFKYLR